MNSFSSVVNYHLLIDNLLNPIHVRLRHTYSHGLDCIGSFGFWWRPYIHIYNLSCARLCYVQLHSFQIFEDSSLYIVASIHLCNIRGLILVSHVVIKYYKGSSVPLYWTWNPQIWFCIWNWSLEEFWGIKWASKGK